MERETRPPDSGNVRSAAFATAIPPLLLFFTGGLYADTSVFRCTTFDGAIEFSQFPCSDGASEQEISIADRKTGWAPSDTPKRQTTKKTEKSRNRKRKTGGSDQTAARREEQCWKKRQRIEEVNRKLRRGYKAGQGVKLRDRRRDYEAYVRKFCG